MLDSDIAETLEKAGYAVAPAIPPKGCYAQKWVIRFGSEGLIRDLILLTPFGYRLCFREDSVLLQLLAAYIQPVYF